MFDLIVLVGFLLQVVNLSEQGRGKIHYPLMIVVYSCFAVSEGWVAMADDRTSYWLFVSLSSFGVLQGIRGYVRTKNLFNRKTS
jgi:hypothetical protein